MQTETHTREQIPLTKNLTKKQEPYWQMFLRRLIIMNVGLLIMAFGIRGVIGANMGASPWDVLHIGVTLHTPLSFGVANQLVGLPMLAIACWMAKSWPKIGTLINILMLGPYCDWIKPLIPEQTHWYWMLLQFAVSVVIMGFGVGFYIASQLGAGPRDWLMLSINQKTGWSIRWVRTMIEVSAVIVGIFLGGPFSIGTILFSLTIGHPTEWGLKWATRVFQPYVQRREWDHETFN
ncbi:YitT family protein [Tumebacillus sp. ITR2]|uniref:YitT family protein n=1 Tax=Tumebacillus amylolyticus TaxID=2801339 RepID=A0ABS1JAU5_9BACL|nr:YitT family protein [Tumebacillus amylolyticus]